MKVEIPSSAPVSVDSMDAFLSHGSARRQFRTLVGWIAVTDAVAVACGFLLAHAVRFGTARPQGDQLLVTLLAPVAWLVILAAHRAYDVFRLSSPEQSRRVLSATAVGMTLLVMLSFWLKQSFSRLWIAVAWIAVPLLLLLGRRMWDGWVRMKRREGRFTFATLIVGTDDHATRLAAALSAARDGYQAIGHLAGSRASAGDRLDLAVLGDAADLRSVVDWTGAECAFVSPSSLTPEEMPTVLRDAGRAAIEVRLTANLPDMTGARIAPQPAGGMTALSLRPVRLSGPQQGAKRALDVVGSVLGLFLLAPLFIAIGLAVKLSSRGPIIYGQIRVGRRGERFPMLKFRSMVRDADAVQDELVARDEASGPLFKMRFDPRVTAIGRLLRRWSLDELPQLFNVLAGDMSLVGPRPSLPGEVERYENWHGDRLEVKPGITGLWQVSGRSVLEFEDYVRLDLYYIENWSILLDLS